LLCSDYSKDISWIVNYANRYRKLIFQDSTKAGADIDHGNAVNKVSLFNTAKNPVNKVIF